MAAKIQIGVVFVLLGILLTACNFSTDQPTPTVDSPVEEPIVPIPQQTPTTEPSPSPTVSPAPSPTSQEIAIASPTLEPTTLPSETPAPTATAGPWEYVIQEGDTLGFIIQLPPHNYPGYDQSVIDRIVAINENIFSADILPPPGTTILIPRPTPIPVVVDVDEEGNSVLASSTQGPTTRGRVSIDGVTGCHEVRENETVVDIVEQYGGMTLEILSQLNADINFFGCNFEQPGGGPNCAPIIQPNQCVNVLLPTPTITLTPTPSGQETPTLTPTFYAPYLIYPLNNEIVEGDRVRLLWSGVGVLEEDEYYLVQVSNTATGNFWADATKANAIVVDESIRPVGEESDVIMWSVVVASPDANGVFAPIGENAIQREFIWQP